MSTCRAPRWRVVALAVVLVSGCGSSPGTLVPTTAAPVISSAPITSASVPPSTRPPPSSPASIPLPDETNVSAIPGSRSMPTSSQGYWLTLAGKFAWVANETDGLARYDLATGHLAGRTALAEDFCQGMEVGFGSLWVSNCTVPKVLRVRLADGTVSADIPISSGLRDEASIAVTDNGVWAVTKKASLVHIDPMTNAIVGEIPAPLGAAALRGGFGSLWLTNASGDVSRIDPASGSIVATLHAGSGAGFLAVGLGSVWVLNSGAATVTRIDPLTDAVVANIPVGSEPVDGGDIAVGGSFVWARVSDSLVAKVDPSSNRTIARFGPASGSGSVGADANALWISIENQMLLWRVPLR